MKPTRKNLIVGFTALIFIAMACTFSLGNDTGSSAEETLQAIYIAQTVEALEQVQSQLDSEAQQPTATIEVHHTLIPGEPGWVSQWWLDTSSKNTASQKRAYGGDVLSQNLLERPFTSEDMVFRPDVDLGRVEISQGNTFYYFMLHLEGLNPDTDMLSAYYGVEVDLDKDARGDFLIWALGDGSKEWSIADVYVYEDGNTDVGGKRPLLADAPDYDGDSYDEKLFSSTI